MTTDEETPVAITLTGEARTQKSEFNWDFDVTQLLLLSFDAPNEQFTAAPFGSAAVNVHGPFAAIIDAFAKPRIQQQVGGQLQGAVSGIAAALSLGQRKDELVNQLRTIDDQANAWLDEAVFTPDGVIVRGQIALSPRRGPAHVVKTTHEQDGYTAFDSWIPGGRIDSFRWSWTWFNNAGDAGSDTRTDRFLLRRPPGGSIGNFGLALGLRRPLPGLDGMGQVCLIIHGVQVHPVTGDLVPVSTARKCRRFGFDINLATPGRVFLREWVPGPRDPIGPVAEAAIHEIGGPRTRGHGGNTLVVRTGDEWNREVAVALRDGLASSGRRDAGLLVLILFPDGTLMRSGAEVTAQFGELAAELQAPLVVNEDVGGSWSKALRMDGDEEAAGQRLEWRLVSPTGGVTWAHRGPTTPRELASALDDYLFPSPAAVVSPIMPRVEPGARASSLVLDAGLTEHLFEVESSCPPPPLGRFGIATGVTFVKKNSAASDAALRKLAEEHGRRTSEQFAVVIVDGADPGDIDQLSRSLPEGTLAFPDPDGAISRRFGVRVWPSSVAVNDAGRVTEFEMGSDSAARPPRSGEAS